MPLTSLADDIARLKKMIAQQKGNVLLVGHSYGGAVVTQAGNMPNVAGLVYIAAFAPDAGESPRGITQANPPAAIASVAPDSDGYLWIKPDLYHSSFCQDLAADEALVMGSRRRRRSVRPSVIMSQRLPGGQSRVGIKFPARTA